MNPLFGLLGAAGLALMEVIFCFGWAFLFVAAGFGGLLGAPMNPYEDLPIGNAAIQRLVRANAAIPRAIADHPAPSIPKTPGLSFMRRG